MRITMTHFPALLTALALAAAVVPPQAVTDAAPLGVCNLTGAGTACGSPGNALRAVRPMEAW
jgi:hypothetical protein